MIKMLRSTLLCLLLPLTIFRVHAQDTTATRSVDTNYKFPKAILVQLRSEHNRIAALAAAHRYNDGEMVKEDASRIMRNEIADFKDHVTFCPVYFYIDTNMEQVMNGKLAGVLFNADSTPAINTGLSASNRDYLIVYYGYPDYQSRAKDSVPDDPKNYKYNGGEKMNRGMTNYLVENFNYPYGTRTDSITSKKEEDGYGPTEPFGKGLVINNNRFQQVSFIYKFGYENVIFRLSGDNRKYIFVSKHFDLEYFPFAGKLNAKLVEMHEKARKNKLRITHYPGADIWALLLGKKVK